MLGKVWAAGVSIANKAPVAFVNFMVLSHWLSYELNLGSYPGASAVQISQLANQATVNFLIVISLFLSFTLSAVSGLAKDVGRIAAALSAEATAANTAVSGAATANPSATPAQGDSARSRR